MGPYRVEGDLSQLELVDADATSTTSLGAGILTLPLSSSVIKPFLLTAPIPNSVSRLPNAVTQAEGGTPNPGQIKM